MEVSIRGAGQQAQLAGGGMLDRKVDNALQQLQQAAKDV